jgi:calcium-dependent protein kinase
MKVKDVEREVDSIMRFCDVDGNGLIDFSEFVSVCVDRKNLLEESSL